MIAWRNSQVLIGSGGIDHLKTTKETTLDVGWDASGSKVVDVERAQPVVPKSGDHSRTPSFVALYHSTVQVEVNRLPETAQVWFCIAAMHAEVIEGSREVGQSLIA